MLVQLSDTHIVAPGLRLMRQIDSAPLLAATVQAVLRLRPAPTAIVITGDLVDRGDAQEYAHLRALLQPLLDTGCPLHLLPGNHDAVPALRAAWTELPTLAPLADPRLAPFVLFATRLGGLRLVALDTVVAGAPYCTLCAHRLRWLDTTLGEDATTPTLVAMHHPPFITGVAHMDGMGLREGAEGLAAVLRRHPQVERVICGHLHRPIVRRFAGTVAMTVPSTAHQITLDLRPDGPPAWRMEPAGFAVHTLCDGAVVTHIAAAGEFGQSQAFG